MSDRPKHLPQRELERLGDALGLPDAVVALGNTGRTAHMGATAELKAVAAGIVRAVRVMDGRNRQRFRDDQQLLGAWVAASTVLGVPARGGDAGTVPPGEVAPGGTVPPAAGEVRQEKAIWGGRLEAARNSGFAVGRR